MLYHVEGVLAESTILAEIDSKRAVADHRVQRLTEAIDIEAVGGDRLPREFATGAETTDIAYEAEFPAGRDLVPDPRAYYWIDPFKVARAGDRHAARSLKLETEFPQIDGKRAGQRSETSTSWFQYRALPIRSKAVKLPGALCQRATS